MKLGFGLPHFTPTPVPFLRRARGLPSLAAHFLLPYRALTLSGPPPHSLHRATVVAWATAVRRATSISGI